MNSKEEFTVQMKRKVAEIEEILKEYLPKPEGYQKVIMEAMEYSLMAGGKRLRPMLMNIAEAERLHILSMEKIWGYWQGMHF